MRSLLLAVISIWLPAIANAAPPQYFTQPGIVTIGGGCTTAFYTDATCKPCGVGMKSSGQYPVVTGTLPANGAAQFWTMGDVPDADPTDPTICTAAQWQAKYGWTVPDTTADNVAMCNFVEQRLGYSNSDWNACTSGTFTGRIFYLSQSGNDTTAVVNDPTHPYATISGILGTPSVAGPLQTVKSDFTLTANLTSASNVITVTATAGTVQKTQAVSGAGIPANTFIFGQLTGTKGGTGTYVMTNNASANETNDSISVGHLEGGVIVIRGGVWSTTAIDMNPQQGVNASFELSGSYGHPLLIMAYPGETVEDQYVNSYAVSILGGEPPAKAACCVTFDGIEFNSTKFYTGVGIKIAQFEDMTVENSEISGYDDGIQTAPRVLGLTIKNDVFHEVAAHAIYIAFGTVYNPPPPPNYNAYCDLPAAQDFNFASDDAKYLNGTSCGSIYQVHIVDDVAYDGGDSGLDPFHINAFVDQTNIARNIVSYSGGSGYDLQSGNYNTTVAGNIAFDLGGNCFELFLSGNNTQPNGAGNGVATHRWNTFANNTCWLPDPASLIWGKQAGSAVEQATGIAYMTASLDGTTNTMTVTVKSGVGIAPGMVLVGTGIPNGVTILPYLTNSTTGTGGTGTYALSGSVTTEPSESIDGKDPLGNSISDTTFKNNVIVTYDNNQSIGPNGCCTNAIPFDFEYNTYPETNSITGNTFWSSGSTSRMMVVSSDASTVATVPSGNYTTFGSGGTCSVANGFSSCFSGNTYAGANPYANASNALYQTPGAFDFGTHNLR